MAETSSLVDAPRARFAEHAPKHPAQRGYADWLERRGFEYDSPLVDAGRSHAALWHLWLCEHECGVAHLDYSEAAS